MSGKTAGCHAPCGLEGCRTYGCLRHMFNVPEPVRGCICPPTSEQTCMSPTCPRKAPQPPVVVRYSNKTGET